MSRLIYLTFSQIPSKRANSFQSFVMGYYMSKKVSDFLMIVPRGENKTDPFLYYNYLPNHKFKIDYINHYQFNFLAKISELFWFNLKRLNFSVLLFFKLLKLKKKSRIFTRDPILLTLSLFASKLNLNIERVFFEAHKTYPKFSFLFNKCSGIVVTNQYNLNKFSIFNKNIILERNGVELKKFQNLKYKKLDVKNINVSYIGSFQKWKGVDTLIKAFSYLGPEFNLILVGVKKCEKETITNFCLNNSVKNFEIFEYVNQNELMKFYERADVLILPNSNKYKDNLSTSPIKLFEYMATKRLIIASNIDSVKEVLNKNNALLFDSENPIDLANKINNLKGFDNSQIVKKSFKDVKNFTWESRAERIVNFISV